jgi:hypothetical protein
MGAGAVLPAGQSFGTSSCNVPLPAAKSWRVVEEFFVAAPATTIASKPHSIAARIFFMPVSFAK